MVHNMLHNVSEKFQHREDDLMIQKLTVFLTHCQNIEISVDCNIFITNIFLHHKNKLFDFCIDNLLFVLQVGVS